MRYSNSADVIDSRDIVERIEELESMQEDFQLDNDLQPYAGEGMNEEEKWNEWEETDEWEELKILLELQEQCEGYCDWRDGATLVRDTYAQQYAQQLAEDIGAIPSDLSWPCTCIDWEDATDELLQDYTSVDYDGVAYWVR
jgi:hypothetical protein